MTTVSKILKKAEKLNHDQRWQLMIEFGRKSLKDQEVALSLKELANSEIHYERLLALMSLQGSFNKELIIKFLNDPSAIGLFAAVRLAARHLETEQLVSIIPLLSKSKRLDIYQQLVKNSRAGVNDLVYESLGSQSKVDILPFTTETFFREHANHETLEMIEYKNWSLLAKRFPNTTYEFLQENLKKSSELSWTVRLAVSVALRGLVNVAPEKGLSLIRSSMGCMNPQSLPLNSYASLFPNEVAELILTYPTPISVSLPVSVLRRLKQETLAGLVAKGVLVDFVKIFPKLFPEQRADLYQSSGEAWRSTNGELPLTCVKALPRSIREAEALHAFHLVMLQSQPTVRIPYLSVLPFSQAKELVEPFLSQPDGDLRAAAVASLVGSGRFHAEVLDSILDFCIARENEQDPVRLEMIDTLAKLPTSRWLVDHLPKIKLIIDAAFRARDCSVQTMNAASRLLLGMITTQTDFVLDELPYLLERTGRLSVPNLESRLSNTEMQQLATRLLPLLRTWIKRDSAHLVQSLMFSFGRRAKAVPEFCQLMVELTSDKRGHVARIGLQGLVQMEFTNELKELIPELIKKDNSWIQVEYVAQYLHQAQQSLLTPFLQPQIYKGRFSSGRTAILPGFDRGFVRWTANQQNLYANGLQGIVNSSKRNAWELYQCVSRLSAMPSVEITPLVRLAQLTTKDIALRDKSIEALGRVDAGKGIPTLLMALNDARARVAIYALRRSFVNMPEKSALPLLSGISSNKVTVLKEVIRLIGEFEGRDAYLQLQHYAESENLHPDVNIALLRAYWQFLHIDEVWDFFHRAATSERVATARSTIRIPQEGLSQAGRKKLSNHLALLLQHSDAGIRRETLERLVSMPIGYSDQSMCETLAQLLEDCDRNICRLAAEAMLAMFVTQKDCDLVKIFAKVTNVKSLIAIVDAFNTRKNINYHSLQTCAEELVHALLERRWQPAQCLRLAMLILPPQTILALIKQLDEQGLLHPGVVESGLKEWGIVVRTQNQQVLEEIEAQLRLAASTEQRRFGLGLLTELTNQYGWTYEQRAQLVDYQNDKALWISDLAELIEPPISLNVPDGI